MKYKVTRQELNECIAAAVTKVLKEDEVDDLLRSLIASDPNAGKAVNAAKKANGIKPAGTGKKGRPKKDDNAGEQINPMDVSDDELIDNMAKTQDAEEPEEEFDKPEVDDEENDEAGFDREYANMPSDALIEILQSNPKSSARYRGANTELGRRKKMLDAYNEDGVKPEWGYKFDPQGRYIINGKPYKYSGYIEPTHVPKNFVGSVGGDASSVYGGMNFGWGHTSAENYE